MAHGGHGIVSDFGLVFYCATPWLQLLVHHREAYMTESIHARVAVVLCPPSYVTLWDENGSLHSRGVDRVPVQLVICLRVMSGVWGCGGRAV